MNRICVTIIRIITIGKYNCQIRYSLVVGCYLQNTWSAQIVLISKRFRLQSFMLLPGITVPVLKPTLPATSLELQFQSYLGLLLTEFMLHLCKAKVVGAAAAATACGPEPPNINGVPIPCQCRQISIKLSTEDWDRDQDQPRQAGDRYGHMTGNDHMDMAI